MGGSLGLVVVGGVPALGGGCGGGGGGLGLGLALLAGALGRVGGDAAVFVRVLALGGELEACAAVGGAGGWGGEVGGGGGDADFGGLVAAGSLGGREVLGVRVGVDLGCCWEGREDVELGCDGADEGVGCLHLGDDGGALGVGEVCLVVDLVLDGLGFSLELLLGPVEVGVDVPVGGGWAVVLIWLGLVVRTGGALG